MRFRYTKDLEVDSIAIGDYNNWDGDEPDDNDLDRILYFGQSVAIFVDGDCDDTSIFEMSKMVGLNRHCRRMNKSRSHHVSQ